MDQPNRTGRIIGAALIAGAGALGGAVLYGFAVGPGVEPAEPPGATRTAMALVPGAVPRLQPGRGEGVPPETRQGGGGLADVDTMIARLAERLARQPDDLDGWKMLGWSSLNTGDLAGAVSAYAHAVELAPKDDELLSLYGEAVTRANGGLVDDRALAIFVDSLKLNPRNPRAGFFKGLALDQSGDTEAALAVWLDVLDASPEGADWVPGLIARIKERAEAVGHDLSGYPRLAAAPATAGVGEAATLSLPTADEIRAARQMSGEDRQAMIEGMVAGLAARLAESPDDPEGWTRLIRSYVVLGRREAALEGLATARETFAGRAETLAAINRTASELGLD